MTDYFPWGAAVVCLTALWAAATDLVYRKISNKAVVTVLAVTLVGFLWITKPGFTWAGLWEAGAGSGLAGALLVLFAGFGLHLIGKVGAGDVKMTAALMLWMGNDGLLFFIVMSLAGGAMVLGLPLLRYVEETLSLAVYRWDGKKRLPACLTAPLTGLPYGPAIAVGVLMVTLTRLF